MPSLTELLGRTYRGYTGSQGEQGIQGIQGITGIQGLTGIQGVSGAQGEPGVTVYDFGVVSIETPTAGSVIGKIIFPRNVSIPQNFTGSRGDVDVAPTTDPYVIDVTKNGSSVGNISISANGNVDFASSNTISIVEGDIIRFIAPSPSPAETTITGIAITLAGNIA